MNTLEQIKQLFSLHSRDSVNHHSLWLSAQIAQVLRQSYMQGGEWYPPTDHANNEALSSAYDKAARDLERRGFAAAAMEVMVDAWQNLALLQRQLNQRVRRGAIAHYIGLAAIGHQDKGAVLWWILHAHADDVLQEDAEGRGAQQILQNMLGLPRDAIERLSAFAREHRTAITRGERTWSHPEAFAEEAVVRFAYDYPLASYYFGLQTQTVEFPLTCAYLQALLERAKIGNGPALEHLGAYLMISLAGWVPRGNVIAADGTHQLDLVVTNMNREGNVTTELLGRHVLVECKNWSDPVPVRDTGFFLYKMHLTGARFGIIIAANKITGSQFAEDRYAQALLTKAYQRDNLICVVLDRNDLDQMSRGEATLWAKLIELLERARFGRAGSLKLPKSAHDLDNPHP